MNEETTAVAPTKMCEIGQVLNPSVIELLRVAPMNQVARAQVLAACLKPIPPELSEFEQIKDWIEANIDVTVVVGARTRRAGMPILNQRDPVPTPPTPENALTVVVDCEDVEYGRCRYSVSRYGSYHHSFTHEDLMGIVRNYNTVADVVQCLSDNSKEEANDDWPEMEWSDDGADHDEHEPTAVEDYNTTVNRNAIERDLVGWMRVNCPGQLARLQGGIDPDELDEEEEDPEEHVPEE